MEKIPKKAYKMKKRQPLKVVYITNPIKIETSALEFRALVQELTGQDADVAYGGGGEAVKAHHAIAAVEEEEATKFSGEVTEQEEFDLPNDDSFVSSLMIDLFDMLEDLDEM